MGFAFFGGRARGRIIEALGTIIYNILIYGFVNHDFWPFAPSLSPFKEISLPYELGDSNPES